MAVSVATVVWAAFNMRRTGDRRSHDSWTSDSTRNVSRASDGSGQAGRAYRWTGNGRSTHMRTRDARRSQHWTRNGHPVSTVACASVSSISPVRTVSSLRTVSSMPTIKSVTAPDSFSSFARCGGRNGAQSKRDELEWKDRNLRWDIFSADGILSDGNI